MKKIIILLAIALIAFNSYGQDNDLSKQLEQLMKEENVIGVSAGYAVNGKTVWESAKGFADKKAKQAFELDTKVRMASIAKSMTALAVMQLVEKGLIDLDAPIQTYIPDYPKQSNTQISTRHLLSHTSGIDGYKNSKEAETKTNYPRLSDALELFKNRTLLFEPGTKYNYSTYGYTVLGVIIERTSGLTYETYMQKNIWDKAGMTNTGVDKFGEKINKTSCLYASNGKGKTKDGNENNLSNRIPGGGFYSTVGDMLKFGNAVINNTFVKAETLGIMREHHSLEKYRNGYGYGWFLYNPTPNEGGIIGHSGAQTGCSSQLFIIPKKGIVTIVLANTSRTSVTPFAAHLMKIAMEK